MHNDVEDTVKKALESILQEFNVTGTWLPETTTVKKQFFCEFAAILRADKGLEGIIALSIPSGVATMLAKISRSGSIEEDAKKLIDGIAHEMAYRGHTVNVAFTVNHIIGSADPRYPAPVPRRLLPFVSGPGNLILEVYLRRPSIFGKQGKEWWNISTDKIGGTV